MSVNPCYVDEPDPAAHLLDAEAEAWDAYRGLRFSDAEKRAAWLKLIKEIESIREEAGWPRLTDR